MKQIPGQLEFSFNGTEYRIVKHRRRRHRIKRRHRSHLRDAWAAYGISKERYCELKAYCQNKGDNNITLVAETAYETNALIGEYLYISVTKNLSYEGVEYLDGHRIPCGRTDFYGWRRRMYANLNERLKQEGK